jgi:hypothetical protein
MARYVVVEFKNNGDAEAFIERIHQDTAQGTMRRIVGVFVKPGRTCDCRNWQRTNSGDKNQAVTIVRGGKFGWWVCTACNRPRKAGHQLVNQVLPSSLYPELGSTKDSQWEFCVDNLSVGSIHTNNIDRPKKLRKVRKLWQAGL